MLSQHALAFTPFEKSLRQNAGNGACTSAVLANYRTCMFKTRVGTGSIYLPPLATALCTGFAALWKTMVIIVYLFYHILFAKAL